MALIPDSADDVGPCRPVRALREWLHGAMGIRAMTTGSRHKGFVLTFYRAISFCLKLVEGAFIWV